MVFNADSIERDAYIQKLADFRAKVINNVCTKPTKIQFRYPPEVKCVYEEYRVRVEFRIDIINDMANDGTPTIYSVKYFINKLDKYDRLMKSPIGYSCAKSDVVAESVDDVITKLRIRLLNDLRNNQGEPKARRIKKKTELEPYRFNGSNPYNICEISHFGQSMRFVEINHSFNRCSCEGIVALTDDLAINYDISNIKHDDCWFKIVCIPITAGKTEFKLLVKSIDGELRYYLLNTTNSRVTDLVDRNGVDYSKLSIIDCKMIELTIDDFMKKF